MTKIKTFIHGIYPRSQNLVRVTRDLDRGRAKASDYKRELGSDFNSLITSQKEAKFDYLETGLLNWQDIFRPIVEATDGLEAEVITRWFDNNTFFRQPRITKNKLKFDEKKLAKFLFRASGNQPASNASQSDAGWKVTLPSPFTFAKSVDAGDWNFDKTLGEITEILSLVCDLLIARGVSFVQFNEPYLVYHEASNKDLNSFNKSIRKIIGKRNGTKTSVQFYFGDVSKIIKKIDLSSFDVLGIDFYKTNPKSLPKIPNDISAGIVEGRNSLIEEQENLVKFVSGLLNKTEGELYITNNSDLELLPQEVAAKKIKVLGKVAAALLNKSAA